MLKKIMNISCREATILAIRKESNKISVFENAKLKVHFSICNGCKRFAAQSKLIGENAKNSDRYINAAMALEKKNDIKKMMI